MGSCFAIVGPNGGGKSTLFHILSTLFSFERGEVRILGCDARIQRAEVRRQIGVLFQNPALDPKLTIRENCVLQARLTSTLSGSRLRKAIEASCERAGILDRLHERVEFLSGGLQRRAEIAKTLMATPELLLMDEPTTGLDPAARREFWTWLRGLMRDQSLTICFTTHLLDEAETAQEVAFLDQGKILIQGSPAELCATNRGQSVSIRSTHATPLAKQVQDRFGISAKVVDDEVRFERESAYAVVAEVASAFPEWVDSVKIARPGLEDLFFERTGRRFAEGAV
jgi:ABC-2 type transport system ATP-binding protein